MLQEEVSALGGPLVLRVRTGEVLTY
jgi:hypothetical protein